METCLTAGRDTQVVEGGFKKYSRDIVK